MNIPNRFPTPRNQPAWPAYPAPVAQMMDEDDGQGNTNTTTHTPVAQQQQEEEAEPIPNKLLAVAKETLAIERGILGIVKERLAVEKKRLALEQERLALEKERFALEKERLALDKKASADACQPQPKRRSSMAKPTQSVEIDSEEDVVEVRPPHKTKRTREYETHPPSTKMSRGNNHMSYQGSHGDRFRY